MQQVTMAKHNTNICSTSRIQSYGTWDDLKILVLWYPHSNLPKSILLSQMSSNKFHNMAKINDKTEQSKNMWFQASIIK